MSKKKKRKEKKRCLSSSSSEALDAKTESSRKKYSKQKLKDEGSCSKKHKRHRRETRSPGHSVIPGYSSKIKDKKLRQDNGSQAKLSKCKTSDERNFSVKSKIRSYKQAPGNITKCQVKLPNQSTWKESSTKQTFEEKAKVEVNSEAYIEHLLCTSNYGTSRDLSRSAVQKSNSDRFAKDCNIQQNAMLQNTELKNNYVQISKFSEQLGQKLNAKNKTFTKSASPCKQKSSTTHPTHASLIKMKIAKKSMMLKTSHKVNESVPTPNSEKLSNCETINCSVAEKMKEGSSCHASEFFKNKYIQRKKVECTNDFRLQSPPKEPFFTSFTKQVLVSSSTVRNQKASNEHKKVETKCIEESPIFSQTISKIPSSCSEVQDDHSTDQEMQLAEELHVARSEKRLEVDVVNCYGELTSMDIDLPEEDAKLLIRKKNLAQNLLIVLDTNILLSHLDFIRMLKEHGIPGMGFPVLIIPWVVLQELDAVKNGKLSLLVVKKAIPAVNFIYTCLKSQDPRLWGQSMQQASQETYGLSIENNDDRVLQCCLQYQNMYPNVNVVLCTNDKNLCCKAMLSGMKAVSKSDLVIELENLGNSRCVHSSQDSQDTSHQKKESCSRQCENKEESQDNNSLSTYDVASVISTIKESLRKALSVVLETEMKIAFDNLWTEIVYVKPPWTLSDILKCFKKHWIAVFGQLVSRNLLHNVNSLYDSLYKGQNIDRPSIKIILQDALHVLYSFSSRSSYDGILSEACVTLSQLAQCVFQSDFKVAENYCTAFENKIPSITVRSSENEPIMSGDYDSPQQAVCHQDIWAVFERIWNAVCQYSKAIFETFNYPCTLEAVLPDINRPTPHEAFVCLQKLMLLGKELLKAFERVLETNVCFEDVQALHNFITNCEIISVDQRFTAQRLYECISQYEYRMKLEVGKNQLAELSYNLERCNTAICTEARNMGWI
ncbi:transcriptional protein SWT1 [Erpetoichthys calabaricus]|uniref:Transcriptional protein SWT1 n=1 Tax=Erpetoichthys calabaricus TaxID=27687 RepID=A0A8C4SKV4_ERPCA|nr:transcriptional protein SWT1 [Erpetoichthys calabaricus]